MASLREIRGRIKSAKNIQQITKAMKMVAAARLRKSQDRMLAARPYASLVAEVLKEIAGAEGMPVGTAKCYAHRGRNGLRKRLTA